MRRPAFAAYLAAGLLVLVGGRSPSFAAEASKPDAAVEALLSKLEAPPLRESVQRIVGMGAVRRDRTTALRVASVLWHASGHASAVGLLALSKHNDAEVRVTALRGVAHVGLRMKSGFDAVREAMGDRDTRVREAALEAVGRVGDAQDVPDLLDGIEVTDEKARHLAFRALVALTGQKIPWEASRWVAWWDEAQETLPARIEAALTALESPEETASRDDARITIARYGWMAIPSLRDVAREWIRSSDVRLRTEGFLLVEALRLGDLADEVSSAFRYERHPDAWPAGRQVAVSLGVPTDGVKPPSTYSPDQRNDH